MTDTLFQPWPKTPRLFRDMVITEKLDGTNAAVQIRPVPASELAEIPHPEDVTIDPATGLAYRVTAQSRKRLIFPGDDNFGFAAWVRENQLRLVCLLGAGIHFGEWWGQGIQRGYGLDHKRFSLFNVRRYEKLVRYPITGLALYEDLDVVPTLKLYTFSTDAVQQALSDLAEGGSVAAPGFMNPEGIIVFHTASGSVYKVLIENDDVPKGLVA